jgi:hypothetical protein
VKAALFSASAAALCFAVGEAMPDDVMTGTAKLVGNLGIVGVLVWYLYYTTSVTFPRICQEFQVSVADGRKELAVVLDRVADQLGDVRNVVAACEIAQGHRELEHRHKGGAM